MTRGARVLTGDAITGLGSSINPFVVVADGVGFINFLAAVFGAEEDLQARTAAPSGALIHAQVHMGDTLLMLCEPQEGWPEIQGLLQVWVADAAAVLAAGEGLGAVVVTPPTPFYGSVTLARMQDPWGNLWWLYQPSPGQPDPKPAWQGGSDVIFRTIDEHMRARTTPPASD